MVTSCCAYGCTYRHKKGSTVGIYRFPKNQSRLKAWVAAVKRKNWKPTAASRICGKHFQTGKPSEDKNHPDYVPNCFIFRQKQNSAHLYEKRKRNLEKKLTAIKEKDAAEALILMSCCAPAPDAPEEEMRTDEEITEQNQKELIKSLYLEINSLRMENFNSRLQVKNLDPTESILLDNKKLLLHTGLKSIEVFQWLLDVVKNEITQNILSVETQLLIVLMKLKLNLLASYLACKFNTSKNTIRRIFDCWIPVLAGQLKYLITWPTKKALKKQMPKCFKNSVYSKTVCIVDCSEVPIQKAGNDMARAQTWSNYKHSHTIKFLIGSSPRGHICFLSDVWGGRASDREITLQSGFLNFINPGDTVLADRGFVLNDYFKSKGAELVVPSFVKGKKQLSRDEVHYSKKVSNVRIHVERVIKQIKRFRIMLTSIPIGFLKYIDSVLIICAALSNLSSTIVRDPEECAQINNAKK